MTFDEVEGAGTRQACELAQQVARLLLESLAADGTSMRQLARECEIDVRPSRVSSKAHSCHGSTRSPDSWRHVTFASRAYSAPRSAADRAQYVRGSAVVLAVAAWSGKWPKPSSAYAAR